MRLTAVGDPGITGVIQQGAGAGLPPPPDAVFQEPTASTAKNRSSIPATERRER